MYGGGYGGGAGAMAGYGGTDKDSLVMQTKEWQKRSPGHKESWYTFVLERGTSNFDPNRHDEATLMEFMALANDGALDVTKEPKGFGKGGGKWDAGGKGGGCGWNAGAGGGGWGGDAWSGGGKACGGKGGGKPTPWDMMNMMQTMWEWGGNKGGGKGGKGKGGGGDGGGGGGGAGESKPGDWVCPDCANVNFSHRSTCNKCGGSGRGQTRLGMKPGDWICPGCGDLVFASKSACKMCSTPKPVEGYGGDASAGYGGAAAAGYGATDASGYAAAAMGGGAARFSPY